VQKPIATYFSAVGQEDAGCAVAKYVRPEYSSAFLGVLALIVFHLAWDGRSTICREPRREVLKIGEKAVVLKAIEEGSNGSHESHRSR
jgi:hypothetical protein